MEDGTRNMGREPLGSLGAGSGTPRKPRGRLRNQELGTSYRFWSLAAAYWGLSGFVLLIVQALFRFYPIIETTVSEASSLGELMMVSASLIVFGIGKGYLLLHRRFAPKFARRVVELTAPRVPVHHRILAPLYCLQLVGAERSGLIRGYGLTAAIVLMIIGAKKLPDSLYGPVIVGVAAALAVGVVSTIVQSVRAISMEAADRSDQAEVVDADPLAA